MLASRFMILLEKRILFRNIPKNPLLPSYVMRFSSNPKTPENKDKFDLAHNKNKNQNNQTNKDKFDFNRIFNRNQNNLTHKDKFDFNRNKDRDRNKNRDRNNLINEDRFDLNRNKDRDQNNLTHKDKFDFNRTKNRDRNNIKNEDRFDLNPIDNKNQNNQINPRSLEIYVGNLPFDSTDEDIIKFFSKCGTPSIKPQLRDKYNLKRNFVFIRFQNENEVNKAVDLNETEFMGRKLKITKAGDPENAEKANKEIIDKQKEIKSKVVYIWNLPLDATKKDIKEALSTVGNISKILIYNDRKKLNQCTAHVEFSNHEDALKAHFHKKFEIKDQRIKAEISFSQKTLEV